LVAVFSGTFLRAAGRCAVPADLAAARVAGLRFGFPPAGGPAILRPGALLPADFRAVTLAVLVASTAVVFSLATLVPATLVSAPFRAAALAGFAAVSASTPLS
jgi:hypothetical protein